MIAVNGFMFLNNKKIPCHRESQNLWQGANERRTDLWENHQNHQPEVCRVPRHAQPEARQIDESIPPAEMVDKSISAGFQNDYRRKTIMKP